MPGNLQANDVQKKIIYQAAFWVGIIIGGVFIVFVSYYAWAGLLYGLIGIWLNEFWVKSIGLLLLGGLILSDIQLSVKLTQSKNEHKKINSGKREVLLTVLAYALTFTLLNTLCYW